MLQDNQAEVKPVEEVIRWAGSKIELARLLGVSHAAVSQWAANGYLPPARAIEIERLSGGLFHAVDLVAEADQGELGDATD